LTRAALAKLPQTCKKLREAGLDESAVVTLRLCTSFVYIGVVEKGVPIGKLAALMLRDECADPQELSWLEVRVIRTAQANGAKLTVQANHRGDPEVQVEDGESLQAETFLQDLDACFRSDLAEAFPDCRGEGDAPIQSW